LYEQAGLCGAVSTRERQGVFESNGIKDPVIATLSADFDRPPAVKAGEHEAVDVGNPADRPVRAPWAS
jgi:hypothetical protein